MPFLSQRTPRESPTLATVSSLSDRRATRQVVPGNDGGETGSVRGATGRCDGADKGQESFEFFGKNTITCKITDCDGRLLSLSSCDLCHQANQPSRLSSCRALRIVLILSSSSFLPLFYPPVRAPNLIPIVCDPNSCRERKDLLVFAICSQREEKLNRGESGPRWEGKENRMGRPPGYRHM